MAKRTEENLDEDILHHKETEMNSGAGSSNSNQAVSSATSQRKFELASESSKENLPKFTVWKQKSSKVKSKRPWPLQGSSAPAAAEPPLKIRRTRLRRVTNAAGEKMLTLGGMRFITVHSFRHKVYVDLKEYYADKATGEYKPSREGILLTIEQYGNLKNLMNKIDGLISRTLRNS